MGKKNPNKANPKTIVENILVGFISIVVVLGGMYLFINNYFLKGKNFNTSNQNNVLGTSDEDELSDVQQIIIESNDSEKNNSEIIITSGIKTDKVILFDNTQRKYFEGTTTANSPVELRIGDFYSITESNPNGFFSIELPDDLVPFKIGQITTLDEDYQIAGSYKFILILRKYLSRTFFIIDKRNEIFSLQLDETYKSSRDHIDKVESDYCIAELDTTINSRDFDIVKDNDVVILPSSVTSLDFDDNKFSAFRIDNKTQTYNQDFCKTEWRNFDESIIWHTEQIDEIFKNPLKFSGFNNPLSDTQK